MSDYKPGSWRLEQEPGQEGLRIILPNGIVWLSSGYKGKAHDDGSSDAHLIASAPDLLGALQKAHEALSATDGYSGSDLESEIEAALSRAAG